MEYSSVVQDLIIWIDKNIECPNALTIDHVAKRVGYSKWHLQRIFRDVTGESLGVYIRGRRLDLACIDLCRGQLRIIEICIQYGFDSQQSFTRSFKRKFKFTPANYRKTHACNTDNLFINDAF